MRNPLLTTRHDSPRILQTSAAAGIPYVDTKDLRDVFVNPIMACPRELLANRGCPFFKRRSFFTPMRMNCAAPTVPPPAPCTIT